MSLSLSYLPPTLLSHPTLPQPLTLPLSLLSHPTLPQVVFFAITSGVEMLIDHWRQIHITLKFKEVEDVDYDVLVHFLEKVTGLSSSSLYL